MERPDLGSSRLQEVLERGASYGVDAEVIVSTGCRIDRSPAERRAWHARMKQREHEAKGKRWEHVDGGCMLAPTPCGGYAPKGEYPCDDTYEDTKTKREVSFPVKQCQHWEMPFAFDDPREVIGLPGVWKPKYRKPPTKKQKRCEAEASRVTGAAEAEVGQEIALRPWWRAHQRCMRRR